MAKCFMCGTAIPQGILCEKCDTPRRPKVAKPASTATQAPLVTSTPPAAAAGGSPQRMTAPKHDPDPFPKAPVVPFPVGSASPAITSIVNLLVSAGVASLLVGPDRSVKFVSDEAKKLFGASQAELSNLKTIEAATGVRIGELSIPASAGIRVRERSILYSLVPISGGASGAVLVFRSTDGISESHASFTTYVRETVFGPLRSLRDSLLAAARARGGEPLLHDSAATVDQVLSSLELAPEVEEPGARVVPTVSDIVHRVAERFRPFSDLKGVKYQIDVPELEETFKDHNQLAEALGILMDNALHYVPAGGQVVLGVRWMEHKGKPLLLFFVMDNGPIVPENQRQAIFEPGFVWNPSLPERTGRSLFKVREFAVAHAGSVWSESKTGKACTFFLRVRPDGVR